MPRTKGDLIVQARLAHARGRVGDYRGVLALIGELDQETEPLARAWSLALMTRVWLAFPSGVTLPTAGRLFELAASDEAAREPVAACCTDLELACVLGFDADALDEVIPVHENLVPHLSELHRIQYESALVWRALLRGDDACEAADALFAAASEVRDPAFVLRTTSQRALAACSTGDVPAATELARRASLMARTEGLPDEEYLAHLTLARVRRFGRQTHRALRIVEALRGVATEPWQAWIDWENVFAAGDVTPAGSGRNATAVAGANSAPESGRWSRRPADRALRAVSDLLEAAVSGKAAAYANAEASLLTASGSSAFARSDAELLISALNVKRRPRSLELASWCKGETPLLPAALHGFRLRARSETDAGSASAYVVTFESETRRILFWGAPLLSTVPLLPQSRRVHGRVETIIAILALAGGGGLPEADCFAQAYEFDYVPERHRGVFDVLLHRAREYVQSYATIERGDGNLRLAIHTPFAVPDPRCSERTTDRLLRFLARHGSANARTAASELGLSLRTVQSALQTLALEGACGVNKNGRVVTYVVEDTVFSEPTLRLHAEQLKEPLPARDAAFGRSG